jgi:hypothetical protein
MADPSPDDTADAGKTPEDGEGQEPEAGDDKDKSEGKGEPKSYPESYVRQLRREAAASRNRLAEVEEKLQEHEDRDKSEVEKLTTRAEAAEKRATDAETRALRYEVAAERGLDPAAASFLTGTTREELELRAEELERLLGEQGTKDRPADFHRGARQPVPEKGPPDKEHNEFLLRAMGRQPSR